MKLKNPLKEDQFLRTSIVWALGLLSMLMVIKFSVLQLTTTYDKAVDELMPFLIVLFGAAYMVRFVGRRPVYYTMICGATVGVGMGLLGLANELLNGLYYESFIRFALVSVFRAVPLALVGGLAGWIMTRGRVPIEIEIPTKKEEEAAHKEGRDVGPRIVTPVAAMPGKQEANTVLLEKLEKDPLSLLSDGERRKYLKRMEKLQKEREATVVKAK